MNTFFKTQKVLQLNNKKFRKNPPKILVRSGNPILSNHVETRSLFVAPPRILSCSALHGLVFVSTVSYLCVGGCFSECLAECANLLKWHRLSISLAGGMEEEWTVHQLG